MSSDLTTCIFLGTHGIIHTRCSLALEVNMRRDDLVYQAAMYLEVQDVLVIFAVARLYAGHKALRGYCELEKKFWQKTGKFSKEVEDFCLDLLSRRLSLEAEFIKLPPKEGGQK